MFGSWSGKGQKRRAPTVLLFFSLKSQQREYEN